LFYGFFTQIALGIAIAEVCAGKKLKNKTILYGSILGTIPDLDVVVGLFLDPVNAVLIHRHQSFALSILFFLLF
jgi:inner membrane protein